MTLNEAVCVQVFEREAVIATKYKKHVMFLGFISLLF